MDETVKQDFELVLDDMGLTMSAAFNVFAKKVAREHKIPFEISGDPFYSESNLEHLRRGIDCVNSGNGVVHELIEESGE